MAGGGSTEGVADGPTTDGSPWDVSGEPAGASPEAASS